MIRVNTSFCKNLGPNSALVSLHVLKVIVCNSITILNAPLNMNQSICFGCFLLQFTLRNDIGNPISTLRNCLESLDAVRSVRFFKVSLIFFSPPAVSRSQSLGKEINLFSPFVCSVIIRTSSEFRILQIVEVDSIFLPLNISFPSILLTNVDFPALVSPYTNMHYINISITNSKIVKSK